MPFSGLLGSAGCECTYYSQQEASRGRFPPVSNNDQTNQRRIVWPTNFVMNSWFLAYSRIMIWPVRGMGRLWPCGVHGSWSDSKGAKEAASAKAPCPLLLNGFHPPQAFAHIAPCKTLHRACLGPVHSPVEQMVVRVARPVTKHETS
jgi:hypothetical protein